MNITITVKWNVGCVRLGNTDVLVIHLISLELRQKIKKQWRGVTKKTLLTNHQYHMIAFFIKFT